MSKKKRNPNIGDECPDLQRRFYHYKNRCKFTSSELAVEKLLTDNGFRFQKQKGLFYVTGDFQCFYMADFYLPKPYYLVVEVDGSIHDTEDQKKRDLRKDHYYTKQRRFRVLRVRNEHVHETLELIKTAFTKPRGMITKSGGFYV